PVCRSRAADTSASRSPIRRWYPQGGRCSVARPSSQEKSHPSTAAAAASDTSSSKLRAMPGIIPSAGAGVSGGPLRRALGRPNLEGDPQFGAVDDAALVVEGEVLFDDLRDPDVIDGLL